MKMGERAIVHPFLYEMKNDLMVLQYGEIRRRKIENDGYKSKSRLKSSERSNIISLFRFHHHTYFFPSTDFDHNWFVEMDMTDKFGFIGRRKLFKK